MRVFKEENVMKVLRQIQYIFLSAIMLVSVNSCSDDFAELNTNPNQSPDLDIGFQFARAMIQSSDNRFEYWRSNLIYPTALVQQATQTWWSGNNYTIVDQWTGAWWGTYYTGYGKNLVDLINRTDATDINTQSAARLWRVHLFQRLTDLYGDAPWFEAGKGFIDQNFQPAYDTQDVIYADLLKETQEAVAAFSASSNPIQGDVIFGGDLDKWRKFGNSLRLRLAMRLTNVDPATAQSEASAAFAAGVMESLDDQPVMFHNDDRRNGNSAVVQADHFRLMEPFVTHMQATNDPRLSIYGGVYDGGVLTGTLPADYLGMAVGAQTNEAGVAQIQLDHFRPNNVPYIHYRYVEVELLLAEAALRGWITSDPAMHYENAVRAGMDMWAIYPGNPTVATADVDAYLAANPYDNSSFDAGMQSIHMQFWVSMFMNGFESYANWRRTGIPALTASDHPSRTISTIPRKMPYPVRESGDNEENFRSAVARQNSTGSNDLSGRMWWDTE